MRELAITHGLHRQSLRELYMEFLETPLFDDDIYKMLVRFGINLFFLVAIVVFAIRPGKKDREYAFTVVMLNVIVFFICFTMKKLELDLGLALGLFAVFGVLRYRTDALRPKEMTYLFIVIGLGVINSLSNKKTSFAEVLLVNLLILVIAVVKEAYVRRAALRENQNSATNDKKKKVKEKNSTELRGTKKGNRYRVEYDKLEWLGIAHREALLTDLKERTGMEISEFRIRKVDLLQRKASLDIWTVPSS